MKQTMGAEFESFLRSLDEPPPVAVRLNPGKPTDVFQGSADVPWHPEGRYLPERPVFTLDPAFHAGAYYVQEASSMFLREALIQVAGVGRKLRVLDFCAAPGGKSTLLLSELNADSLLVANEAIQSRVPALRMNLEKWGYPNAAVSHHDPSEFGKLTGFFDVVLVDAPCSGEGLFRKDSGAVGEWSEPNARLCAARQRRILTQAGDLLKPGGVLIYATCTFNPAENEENVAWLLDSGGYDFLPLRLDSSWGIVEKDGGYQFYPHRVVGEGFFIACLAKRPGEEVSFRSGKHSFGDWQKMKVKDIAPFASWLKTPDAFSFFQKPNGEIVALPVHLEEDFATLSEALRRRSFGTSIGSLKQRDFVPSHALSLSTSIGSGLLSVDLDKSSALQFLKKENIATDGLAKGWTLAKFNGLNLGWMKVLDGRINNYLPNDWRIRMELPQVP